MLCIKWTELCGTETSTGHVFCPVLSCRTVLPVLPHGRTGQDLLLRPVLKQDRTQDRTGRPAGPIDFSFFQKVPKQWIVEYSNPEGVIFSCPFQNNHSVLTHFERINKKKEEKTLS